MSTADFTGTHHTHKAESYVDPEQKTKGIPNPWTEDISFPSLGLRCNICKIRGSNEMVWKVPSINHILQFQRVTLLIQSDPHPQRGLFSKRCMWVPWKAGITAEGLGEHTLHKRHPKSRCLRSLGAGGSLGPPMHWFPTPLQ